MRKPDCRLHRGGEEAVSAVREQVLALCAKYPLYLETIFSKPIISSGRIRGRLPSLNAVVLKRKHPCRPAGRWSVHAENDFGKLIKTTDWLLWRWCWRWCLLGLVTIANATCDPYAENGATGLAGIAARINPYYVLRQLVWIGTGLVLGIAFAAIDYRICVR